MNFGRTHLGLAAGLILGMAVVFASTTPALGPNPLTPLTSPAKAVSYTLDTPTGQNTSSAGNPSQNAAVDLANPSLWASRTASHLASIASDSPPLAALVFLPIVVGVLVAGLVMWAASREGREPDEA